MTAPADDPRALYSPARLALFRLYLHTLFWRRFNAVRVARDGWPAERFAGRPVVVYCNHPSWWDPALLLFVSEKLFPGRRPYAPMAARELERYRLFRRFGVFGIDMDAPRGAARFLRLAGGLLEGGDTLLGVTAEGAFTDSRQRPVRLRPGIAHLARRAPHAVFLPVALEYAFWNEGRPEALLSVGKALPPGDRDVAGWTRLMEDALTEVMDGLAQASASRDPGAFHTLLSGRAGMGGPYDAMRRVRAAVSGQAFSARHEAGEGR